MKKLVRITGTLLFLVGFVALFGESDNAGAQILWSLGAAALCLIGGHLVNTTIKEEEL